MIRISSISCIFITVKIWTFSNWTKPNWAEKVSLFFCLFSLTVWITFNSAWLAHVLLLLAIPVAFVPTYKSALANYQNENSHAWILWSCSDFLILVVIILRLQTFQELPYATLELVCHFSVFAIIYIKKVQSVGGFIIAKNHLGKAVYSTKEYRQGDIILKFEGCIIHKKELPKDIKGNNDHYMQIDFDLYLGPSGKADDYVNHSCNPNAGLIFTADGIYLKAIVNIAKNKEITWDYSTTTFQNDWKMNCECFEPNCRKVITAFTLLDKFLQKKYISLNIVAPYMKSKWMQSSSL